MDRALDILWVKSGPLHPLNTGGRRRTHAMLTELSRKNRVVFLAGLPNGARVSPAEAADPYAAEKIWMPTRESRKGSLRFFAELAKNLAVSRLPYVLDRYRDRGMAARIRELDAGGRFDLIVCDFLTPAVHFANFTPHAPAVLFQHNIESQIWVRLAAEKGNPLVRAYFNSQAERLWRAERDLCARFAGVVTVSPEDAEFSRSEYGLANVLGSVPTGIDTEHFQPSAGARRDPELVGFLGSMDWMPNIECVRHFARDILPLIRERRPGCRFRIIGRDPAPAVRRLAETDAGIEVTGTVDDVRPHVDACALIVVPLRSGGGTRIKIFEAMAQGVPVVSTAIGAEGLPVESGRDILIADDPAEFAAAVSRLLDDPALAAQLAKTAREKLIAGHSWAKVSDAFMSLCHPLLSQRSPTHH